MRHVRVQRAEGLMHSLQEYYQQPTIQVMHEALAPALHNKQQTSTAGKRFIYVPYNN